MVAQRHKDESLAPVSTSLAVPVSLQFSLESPHKSKCHRTRCCNANGLYFWERKSWVLWCWTARQIWDPLNFVVKFLPAPTPTAHLAVGSLSLEPTFLFRSIFHSTSWMNFTREDEEDLSALLNKDFFMKEKNNDYLMNSQKEITVNRLGIISLRVACVVSQLLCL